MNKPYDNVGESLLSNPAIFRKLINQANNKLSIIDLNTGRYLYVNEKTCRSTGYTQVEFRKMTVADIDPTVGTQWNADKERAQRKRSKVFVREGIIKRKDGSCFPVEIHSSLIRVDGRDYMVATACDITERKRATEAFRTARDQMELAVQERTAELITVNESLKKEIAARAQVEKALRKSQTQLHRQKVFLEHKNIALSEMLKQIEWEKHKVETNVAINAREVLLPMLDKMQLSGASEKYIALLKESVKKLTAEYGSIAAHENSKLTPREIEIATMLRSGLGNKEIADLLHITVRSTEWHRYNIRKKLHLKGKRKNLRTILMQFKA